jgi:uncharacterized protein
VKLENAFEVPAPPEEAWQLLMDVPRIIPCMPGTELTEVVDDSNWKAKMNVKLGPISLAFATDVKREDTDEAARVARLSASARELRGRGGGQATIESTLVPLNRGTRVEIVTNLQLSGAVAQYGRGMVQDVSSQLVSQFADCLKARLSGPAEHGEPPRAAPAAKPIAGLPLILGALRRALARLLRRRSS